MIHENDDGVSTARVPTADATLSADPEVRANAPHEAVDVPGPAGASVTPRPARPQRPRPLPDVDRRILVMAIVNRTQDSFFDQGRTFELDAAVEAGMAAAADGADIVDVGGIKFAPGAPLPVDEEIDRVIPVLRRLREQLPATLLSVDTFHGAVARAAIDVGADLINDTTGLSDPEMAPTVAAGDASVVITHSLARPRHNYPRPRYEDVVEEVRDYLAARVEQALEAGVPRDRIVLDPGPDLNKSTVQTLELLREWDQYTESGLPVLAALSRKDVIGESLGLPKEERLEGSLAASAWAMRKGARILRVHDVRATVRMARMFEVISGWRDPAGPLVHNA